MGLKAFPPSFAHYCICGELGEERRREHRGVEEEELGRVKRGCHLQELNK